MVVDFKVSQEPTSQECEQGCRCLWQGLTLGSLSSLDTSASNFAGPPASCNLHGSPGGLSQELSNTGSKLCFLEDTLFSYRLLVFFPAICPFSPLPESPSCTH